MTLKITIDTREKRPWSFPIDRVEAEIGTLKTGDYALSGDSGFAVERKSLDDFCMTISTGWERFNRELSRMDGWPAKVVIVEGEFKNLIFTSKGDTIVSPAHNHHMVKPAFVMKRLSELLYMGVTVVFAGDADCAAAIGFSVLKERWREINEK